MTTLCLNPDLDLAALARRYAEDGRVQIAGVLTVAAAEALYAGLHNRDDWVQVINSGDRVFEADRASRRSLSPQQRETLDSAVYAGARQGFQFRYETIRVPDGAVDRERSADPLAALARFLSEGPARDILRAITGQPAIDFADAQATAFAPGDFLTAHDDAVAGKKRHAAYVLGLTPQWRPEWGGLLLFHDDRDISHGFVPAFNTLNLFRVPQRHSVSEVTRAAPYRRYSVTGWLRSR